LVAALRSRPARRLWFTIGLSSLGDWLGLLAVSLFVFGHLTGSFAQGAGFAAVLVLKLLPALVLLPVAGALADKLDRRLTLAICDAARFVLFLSIPLVGLAGPIPAVVWALVATFLIETLRLIRVAAEDAALANLAPGPGAGQLSQVIAYGVTPVLAALVLGAVERGIRGLVNERTAGLLVQPVDVALYLTALIFLATAIVSYLSPETAGRGSVPNRKGWAGSLLDGWQFLHHNASLRGLVLGVCGALAATAVVAGSAVFYVASLSAGNAGYALLVAALFLGFGLGVGTGPRLIGKLSRRRWFGMSLVFAAAMVTLLGLAPHLSIAVILTVAVGYGAGMAFLSGNTLLGSETRDWVRARVFAFTQAAGRVVVLAVVLITALLVGLGGTHVLNLGVFQPTISAARVLLLVVGIAGVVAGVIAFRRMDDRRGVPVLADLLSSMGGRPLGVPDAPISSGLFVSFEGGEGAGKSTQAVKLAAWLRMSGRQCVVTREPGATPAGARMRGILLDPRGDKLSSRAEALLYAADRAEHVSTVIRPALAQGAVVITDRYVDSSLAYQGTGRELPVEEIRWLSGWATGELRPHLTVLLDVDPRVGLERARARGTIDRVESEELVFHDRVRDSFRTLAAADPERYLIVDASGTEEQIAEQIRVRIAQLMPDAPDPMVAQPWDLEATQQLDPDLDSMLAVAKTQDLRSLQTGVDDVTQRLDR
jgi:dTMP kinase